MFCQSQPDSPISRKENPLPLFPRSYPAMPTTPRPATDHACPTNAKVCILQTLMTIAFVLLITASSAWSITAVLYYLGSWSHSAAVAVTACATLCVVWLFSGRARHAVALWLVCMTVLIAWFLLMPIPLQATPWADEPGISAPWG